ncbi:hypothetical protein RvY_04086-2 [Ramazzottius varieornatus]|nr:hypothetical protein RvY_04086-2 [Ramazzottius varieornatus]
MYGNKDSDAARLRSGSGGMLKINDSPLIKAQNVVMVPGGSDALACVAPSPDRKCVDAGDIRVNLHTGLVALHSLFLREHNRIAQFLFTRLPGATDETTFQMTRKIVGAMVQHISYKEMIPLILGRRLYNDGRNGVALRDTGYSNSYNPDVDATVTVEFAAAAFRLHTLAGNELPVLQDNGTETPFFLHFFNPNMWYKAGVLDQLIAGMARKRAQNFDVDFSFVFQNQMYKPPNRSTGFDQLAMNVQRGRDHGVPTYLQMRKFCGLPPINSLSDLERVTSPQNAANLASIYKNINDVDFFAGGMSEKPVNGEGLSGPTFACILTEQFRRLKNGDRFFYENENVFTPSQLQEIRKVSLATIMCLNSPINNVQARVLEAHSATNPLMSCQDIIARSSMRLDAFL